MTTGGPVVSWRIVGTIVLAIALVTGLSHCYRGVLTMRPERDFVNHRDWVRRLLVGEFLYEGGLNVPYPPFWAVAHAPLAPLSLETAFGLHMALGVAALAIILWLCHRATSLPLSSVAWLIGMVLLALSRPILRNLQDGGANLILTALVWSAIACWSKRRDGMAGALLGTAIALKCTAGLFAGYFLWKRQWKFAGSAIACAALLSVTPIWWQGLPLFRQHIDTWLAHLGKGMGGEDPRIGVLGTEEVRNLALRPTLGRVLLDLPGEPLSPAQAGRVVRFASFAILLVSLWRMRNRIEKGYSPPVSHQCTALLLLTLLLSPITWLPHLVASIPALYLQFTSLWQERRWTPRGLIPLAVILFFLRGPVSPDLLGVDLSRSFERLGATTWAVAALLWMTLAGTGQKSGSNEDAISQRGTRESRRAIAA